MNNYAQTFVSIAVDHKQSIQMDTWKKSMKNFLELGDETRSTVEDGTSSEMNEKQPNGILDEKQPQF